jgi:hypothetical protein
MISGVLRNHLGINPFALPVPPHVVEVHPYLWLFAYQRSQRSQDAAGDGDERARFHPAYVTSGLSGGAFPLNDSLRGSPALQAAIATGPRSFRLRSAYG